jgi:hypothetical protein
MVMNVRAIRPETVQQDNGKRDLRHDERIAHAVPPRRLGARSAGLLEDLYAEHARSQDGNDAQTRRLVTTELPRVTSSTDASMRISFKRGSANRRQPSQQLDARQREHHAERGAGQPSTRLSANKAGSKTARLSPSASTNRKLVAAGPRPPPAASSHVGPRHEEDGWSRSQGESTTGRFKSPPRPQKAGGTFGAADDGGPTILRLTRASVETA